MFVTECSYESYFHFKVSGELPEEGILKGKKGELRFKRIQDGLAVYDSINHSRSVYLILLR
ncbi:TPA: hypothetical protein U1366_000038 [Streptococcus suis]|nr:hypothetical protein [Streptococcus suis]